MYTNLYLYTCIYVLINYMCIYIYIYIFYFFLYILFFYIFLFLSYTYIYIYIYIYVCCSPAEKEYCHPDNLFTCSWGHSFIWAPAHEKLFVMHAPSWIYWLALALCVNGIGHFSTVSFLADWNRSVVDSGMEQAHVRYTVFYMA